MKGKDALAYCRQLLFEQRLVASWETAQRLRVTAAFAAWRLHPGHAMSGTARLEAERERWREEVEYERAAALERSRRDQRQLEQAEARLHAAEGVVTQLRRDNAALREELADALQKLDLGGELEQLRVEREQRAAAGAKAALQEAALRSRLEAEQKRLADGSAQLASLEASLEEKQAKMRPRQSAEERERRRRRDEAQAAFRAARDANGRSLGGAEGREARLLGWRVGLAQARLRLTWRRHDKELENFEEQLSMLDGLRESRDALEWRVTQTRAQLIVMRSAAEGTHGSARTVDVSFGLGGLETGAEVGQGKGALAFERRPSGTAPKSSPLRPELRTATMPVGPQAAEEAQQAAASVVVPLASMPPPNYPPPGFAVAAPSDHKRAMRDVAMVPSPTATPAVS